MIVEALKGSLREARYTDRMLRDTVDIIEARMLATGVINNIPTNTIIRSDTASLALRVRLCREIHESRAGGIIIERSIAAVSTCGVATIT